MSSSEAGLACSLPGAEMLGSARAEVPDFCDPLDAPVWVKNASATLMRDNDTVLGFEAVGQTWAIPWWVMKNHHVANLTLEGEPLLVTLCEACVAGGVFDPMVDGRRLTFYNSGWYRGSPVMTDELTGSLWRLVNGKPLAGPALAEYGPLPMRPIVHSRWHRWRMMYPDGVVVRGQGEPRDGHGAAFDRPDHPSGLPGRDGELRSGALVIGVEVGSQRRAYPIAAVHERGGVVEDALGGQDIVVTSAPGSWLVGGFGRDLAGTPVRLRWEEDPGRAPRLVDEFSGSEFDLWGRGTSGEHRGRRLAHVRVSLKKFGAWKLTYPDADLWSGKLRAR